MKKGFPINSFSMRLLLGFVALVILTTLSAGIPAFWITRGQLEQQAWSQVHNAQNATQSLLEAEQTRLADQIVLFAERPTLQQLARAPAGEVLQLYLQDFQHQSGLDMLTLCSMDNLVLASDGTLDECLPPHRQGFTLLDNRPVILSQVEVMDNLTAELLGTATAGIWLDE